MYTTLLRDKDDTMSASTAAGADAVKLMNGTRDKARNPPIFLKA